MAKILDDSTGPIGSIVSSLLTETQFQNLYGTGWVLMDGRPCTGSKYASVTTATHIPDARGMVLRGRNDGGSALGTRADGLQNPDGLLNLGQSQSDNYQGHDHGGGAHSHTVNSHNHGGGAHGHSGIRTSAGLWANNFYTQSGGISANGLATSPAAGNRVNFDIDPSGTIIGSESPGTGGPSVTVIPSSGGNETRMKNITVNHFIRIN